MFNERSQLVLHKAKPFLGVIFLQAGLAGMDITSKAALDQGMSNYVLVVYPHVVATIVIAPFALCLDRKTRPKMTTSDWSRLEKVKLMSIHSQAKIIGTLATVAGAMIMTLVRGPDIGLPWTKGGTIHAHQQGEVNLQHSIKGAIMITLGCFSWACFMILQAVVLKAYPAELSLTAWICLLGSAESAAVALVMEKGNAAAWSVQWVAKLLAVVYSGVFCSGIGYCIQGAVMKEKGPVFVSAFSPLCMIMVAIMSSFMLSERMFLGRVIGAAVIVTGLYLVIWGKKEEYDSDSAPVEEQQDLTVKKSDRGSLKLEVIIAEDNKR